MPMYQFLGPARVWVEFAYTTVVVFLCALVYFKTKEAYNLTRHKGIKFFRDAFLFFGLAYSSRLLLHLISIGMIVFDVTVHRRVMLPLFSLIVAYFSTMALLFLAYSTVWKKIRLEHFLYFSNLMGLIVAIVAFVSKSPIVISIIQLILLAFIILINVGKIERKRLKIRSLYLLISIFWLLNLFTLGPRRFLSFEIKTAFQVISLLVFVGIYNKLHKWIK